jgi:hypothetical protein
MKEPRGKGPAWIGRELAATHANFVRDTAEVGDDQATEELIAGTPEGSRTTIASPKKEKP